MATDETLRLETLQRVAKNFQRLENDASLRLCVALRQYGELAGADIDDDKAPFPLEPEFDVQRPSELRNALRGLRDDSQSIVRRLLPLEHGGEIESGSWPKLEVSLLGKKKTVLALDFNTFVDPQAYAETRFDIRQPGFLRENLQQLFLNNGYDIEKLSTVPNPRKGPTMDEFYEAVDNAARRNSWGLFSCVM